VIDRGELITRRVLDVQETYNTGETRAERMATDRSGRVHTGDELHILHADPLQTGVPEALVAQQLLQESHELDGVVSIGTGQVEILEEENEAIAFARP